MDDDADCVEHVWGLEEIHPSMDGAELASTCTRCGTVSYEPNASNDPTRSKL